MSSAALSPPQLSLPGPVSTSYMEAPVRFIRSAEQCGLIAKIGAYVLALLASLVLALTVAGLFVVWEGAREYERQSSQFSLGLPGAFPRSPSSPAGSGPSTSTLRSRVHTAAGAASGSAAINSMGLAPFSAAAASAAAARPASSTSSPALPGSAHAHAYPSRAAAAAPAGAGAAGAAQRRGVTFDASVQDKPPRAAPRAADAPQPPIAQKADVRDSFEDPTQATLREMQRSQAQRARLGAPSVGEVFETLNGYSIGDAPAAAAAAAAPRPAIGQGFVDRRPLLGQGFAQAGAAAAAAAAGAPSEVGTSRRPLRREGSNFRTEEFSGSLTRELQTAGRGAPAATLSPFQAQLQDVPAAAGTARGSKFFPVMAQEFADSDEQAEV